MNEQPLPIRQPGATLYFLAFTALPSALLIAFSVLTYGRTIPDRMGTAFMALSYLMVILCLLYDNLSLLYFGRQYRKFFKERGSDWPILCYSLLTFFNLVFIVITYGQGGLSFLNSPGTMYAMMQVNILVPMFLVPLPLASRIGGLWKHLLASAGIAYVSTIGWMTMGCVAYQALGEGSKSLLNALPYRCFFIQTEPSSVLYWFLMATLLIGSVLGYLLHGNLIATIENRRFPRIFILPTCLMLALAFISHGAMIGYSWVIDHDNTRAERRLEQFHGQPFSIESLQKLYFGIQKPNASFWDAFLKSAANPDDYAQIDHLLDGVSELPKFQRDCSSYISGASPELEAMAAYRIFNCARLDAALKNQDVPTVMTYYRYDSMIDQALQGDYLAVAAVQRASFHDQALRAMLKSGLLQEAQVESIYQQCYNREGKTDNQMKRVAFWHDFCFIGLTARRSQERYVKLSDGRYLPFPSIQHARYLCPQLYCAYFQVYRNSLDELDKQGNAPLENLRQQLCRQERLTLLMAAGELFKLRRGRYPKESSELFPDLLPLLPVDPASGKPLEYSFQ